MELLDNLAQAFDEKWWGGKMGGREEDKNNHNHKTNIKKEENKIMGVVPASN